jgi:SAM-dependent methyltransferase
MTYDYPKAWRSGPHGAYRLFACAALDTLDYELAGLSTLDAGAGTGAMGEEMAARGARVIYLDRELSMIRAAPSPRLLSSITSVALADRCVDLAAANFVLSHVDDPAAALRELARVTRPGGIVLATAFPAGDRHPVKHAVDGTLTELGYRTPGWYQRLKDMGEPRFGDLQAMHALARATGLCAIRTWHVDVSLRGLGPDGIVAWRLGMPAIAAFVAGLPAVRRREVTAMARRALTDDVLAQPVRVLVLAGAVG